MVAIYDENASGRGDSLETFMRNEPVNAQYTRGPRWATTGTERNET